MSRRNRRHQAPVKEQERWKKFLSRPESAICPFCFAGRSDPPVVGMLKGTGETTVATVVPRRLERRSETSHPEPGGEIDRSRDGYEISHGFTLVEVLIVVALILTIAAIALPYLSSTLDEARYAKAVADIHTLQDAINADQLQNGVFTDSLATIGF